MTGNDIQLNYLSLGRRLSIITKAQYRYEGIIAGINLIEGVLTLQNVHFHGIENRKPPDGTYTIGNKASIVGTVFDAIAFRKSNIYQMWPLDDKKSLRNESHDKAVVKTAALDDSRRKRRRRQTTWYYAPTQHNGSIKKSSFRNKHTNADLSVVNTHRNSTNQRAIRQPPTLVTYSRKGRNGLSIPNQRDYIPVIPIVTHPPNLYNKSAHPFNTRYSNKKQNQHMRIPNNNYTHHIHNSSVNPYGGVYIYLPPQVPTTFQQRSFNFVAPPVRRTKRRVFERRKATTINSSVQSDLTKPYDFEMANAELAAELAKIKLNPDNDPPVSREHSTANKIASTLVGKVISERPITSTTTNDASRLSTSVNSPSSGDSPTGAVSSTTLNNINGNITENNSSSHHSNGTLSKGEYCAREKCFYDQISRPEARPRQAATGTYDIHNERSKYKKSSKRHYVIGSPSRRERQLNHETFGSMAARKSCWRRRKSSSVPRHLLVSATA
ncbi:unnamed protein product [Schistosoma turkestanicum]|nr:unnamed protein product [Schistosoma turkestanicum]